MTNYHSQQTYNAELASMLTDLQPADIEQIPDPDAGTIELRVIYRLTPTQTQQLYDWMRISMVICDEREGDGGSKSPDKYDPR